MRMVCVSMRFFRSRNVAGTPSITTIVDCESGTTTTIPPRSRSVSCDEFVCTMRPWSTIKVCCVRLMVTLISACDQAPGRRGNGGTLAAPAMPAKANSKRAARVVANIRMDQLSTLAVNSTSPARNSHVKRTGRRLPSAARDSSSQALAPRSVGQLAPQPGLTRQCACDLHSQLEILSPGRTEPVRDLRQVVSCQEIRPSPGSSLSPFWATEACYRGSTDRHSAAVRSGFSFLLFRLFEFLRLDLSYKE